LLSIGEFEAVEKPASAAIVRHPLGRDGLELAAPLLVHAVGPDPASERWPGRDHDLVSEVDPRFVVNLVLVGREQAVIDPLIQYLGEVTGIISRSLQL